MAMISDLTRGAMGGEIPNFSPDMSSSPRGPAGAPVNVEGLVVLSNVTHHLLYFYFRAYNVRR